MSVHKIGKTLLKKVSHKSIAIMVANALREAHQNDSSTVKQIGRKTGINLHAISKWMNARCAPDSVHLITLVQCYPAVFEGIIKMAGYDISVTGEISHPCQFCKSASQEENDSKESTYRVKYVPINVMLPIDVASKLNARQLWFLSKLQHEQMSKTSAIETQWDVSLKTAKRDIQQLMSLKLIRYEGARKTGYYVLV